MTSLVRSVVLLALNFYFVSDVEADGKPPHIIFIMCDDLLTLYVHNVDYDLPGENHAYFCQQRRLEELRLLKPSPHRLTSVTESIALSEEWRQIHTTAYQHLVGFNDVSFNGSPQIPTPNIDALAASGIILNRHYVAPLCTPSRASLMTGRYPTNTGLQHYVIVAGQPFGLPLNFTIMPQYFKRLGYATHMVGKWHLGYHKKEYTPTFRGFDSFFGSWNGNLDYYDYTHYENEDMWGIDLHDGLEPVTHFRGRYATEFFTEKAEEIIRKHKSSQPLFLFLSQIAAHTGNIYQGLQAPPEHVAKFKHLKDVKRRTQAGVISALDESVEKIFEALHEESMLDNSIIIFVSDNGAEVEGQYGAGYGSNWPLRGSKFQLYEGGVRVPALLWSPLLRLKQPRTTKRMMHISDWLPTLYAAAGGNVQDLGNIDGMDMWSYLMKDLPLPRNEVLLNVDPYFGMCSLIHNDYKLINGTHPGDEFGFWYGPSGREDMNVTSLDDWVWRNGSVVKNILQKTKRWLLEVPDQWRENLTVHCGLCPSSSGKGSCDLTVSPCLFNITEDPCEYNNLASERPEVVKMLMNRIRQLNSTSLEALNPEVDHNADPRCHGFTFVPWLEEEHASELCTYMKP